MRWKGRSVQRRRRLQWLGRGQAPMTDSGLSMSTAERPAVVLSGQAFAAGQIRENGSRPGVSGEWQPSTTAINVVWAFNRAKILIQTVRFP